MPIPAGFGDDRDFHPLLSDGAVQSDRRKIDVLADNHAGGVVLRTRSFGTVEGTHGSLLKILQNPVRRGGEMFGLRVQPRVLVAAAQLTVRQGRGRSAWNGSAWDEEVRAG